MQNFEISQSINQSPNQEHQHEKKNKDKKYIKKQSLGSQNQEIDIVQNRRSSLFLDYLIIYNISYCLTGSMLGFFISNPLLTLLNNYSVIEDIFSVSLLMVGLFFALCIILVFQSKMTPHAIHLIIGSSLLLSGVITIIYLLNNIIGVFSIYLIALTYSCSITLISVLCRFLVIQISSIPTNLRFISINVQILNAMFYLGFIFGILVVNFNSSAVQVITLSFIGGFILFKERQASKNGQDIIETRLLASSHIQSQNQINNLNLNRNQAIQQNFPLKFQKITNALSSIYAFFFIGNLFLPFFQQNQIYQFSEKDQISIYGVFIIGLFFKIIVPFIIHSSAIKVLKIQSIILIISSIFFLLISIFQMNQLFVILFPMVIQLVTINSYPLMQIIAVQNHKIKKQNNHTEWVLTHIKMDLKSLANMTLCFVFGSCLVYPLICTVITAIYGPIAYFMIFGILSVSMYICLYFYDKNLNQMLNNN